MNDSAEMYLDKEAFHLHCFALRDIYSRHLWKTLCIYKGFNLVGVRSGVMENSVSSSRSIDHVVAAEKKEFCLIEVPLYQTKFACHIHTRDTVQVRCYSELEACAVIDVDVLEFVHLVFCCHVV